MTSVKETHELCCPQCGHDDELCVAATVSALLTPDGTDFDNMNGDTEYDNDSTIICRRCQRVGTVAQFAWPRPNFRAQFSDILGA